MNDDRQQILVLDGYNVIQRSGALRGARSRGLESARAALIHLCRDGLTLRRDVSEFILVFDGRSPSPAPTDRPIPRIRIHFTRSGEQADDRIRTLLPYLAARYPVAVVSDDNAVQQSARRRGADVISVSDFIVRVRRKKRIRAERPPGGGRTSELTPQQEQEINKMLIREWGLEDGNP